MSRKRTEAIKKEQERLRPYLDKAWMLTPQQRDVVKLLEGDLAAQQEALHKFTTPEVLWHPFKDRDEFFEDTPAHELLRVLRNPSYLPYTCKLFFNIDLAPFQGCILQQLFTKSFPLLVGSRGLGKCVRGDTLIHTSRGIHEIKELAENSLVQEKVVHPNLSILGENGFKSVEYAWNNGKQPTKRIRTKGGYELEGTLNHPIRVFRKDEGIVWKNLEDVLPTDRPIIDRTPRWHGDDAVPSLPNLQAYRLGTRCVHQPVPPAISSGGKEAYRHFIRGVFDVGGRIHPNGTTILETKCYDLARHLQFALLRFGIVSKLHRRDNPDGSLMYAKLIVNCPNSKLLVSEIGFGFKESPGMRGRITKPRQATSCDTIPHHLVHGDIEWLAENIPVLERKYANELYDYRFRAKGQGLTWIKLSRILRCSRIISHTPAYKRLETILNQHFFFDKIVSIEDGCCETFDVHVPDDHSFVSNGFVSHNSWILGLYAMLRLLFDQGCKIAMVGGSFRQAKAIFEYMEGFWYNGSIYRDIVGSKIGRNGKPNGPRKDPDRLEMIVGDSMGFAIPLGDGQKIRGQRANYLLCDEIDSIPAQIFDEVIFGFAAVSSAPVKKAREIASDDLQKSLGLWTDDDEAEAFANITGNQVVLAGTAGYASGHFYKTFKLFKGFIQTQGDPRKYQELRGEPMPVGFSHRDYSIMRMAVELLPVGFMDPKIINTAKSKLSSVVYQKEYAACFPEDSDGFFRRSLIESCVVGNPESPIEMPEYGEVKFKASLTGEQGVRHVIAIDPASENDKFAIVVVAMMKNHRRIVYVWTTDRSSHDTLFHKGVTAERDYYRYCAKKIRELMGRYDTARIAMDSQGGGITIEQALMADFGAGELPIYRIKDPPDTKKPKETDFLPGLHILEMIQFADAKWTSVANHGLRADMESKLILFPFYDTISELVAIEEDRASGRIVQDGEDELRLYDSLVACYEEVQDLKDELCSIVHTKTANGRDRWDVPDIKLPDGKKGRLHKDRYSALLMANMTARTLMDETPEVERKAVGGFAAKLARNSAKKDEGHVWYQNAPGWVNVKAIESFGAVKRTRR